MYPHQGSQGQLPPHWQPPTSQQPQHGSYPPPPHMNSALPPPPAAQSREPPRPDMAAHHHQAQQPYRLPGPQEWNQAPPPPDPYRAPQPPPGYMGQPPAPRQRTAIACRYCRRRKIRCSGFEATDDGRCGNCVRFNQDCIFTPVSAQTQAFVPAHTVWRGVGAPPPMYGAYGQPLPQGDAYGQPPRQQQQQQQQGPPPPPPPQGSYLPSPTGPPGPYQAHSAHGPSAAPYDDASRDPMLGRKRPHPEPHTPTLPPPRPGSAASQLAHRGAGPEYPHPEPPLTSAASPANSSASYSSAPPQHSQQPYYTSQPPRRTSPPGSYPYEGARASSSPHTQAPTTPGGTSYYPAPQTNGNLHPLPTRSDGTTPPPTSQPSRSAMRINDLVSDNGNARSSTDSNMLNMLNRRPM